MADQPTEPRRGSRTSRRIMPQYISITAAVNAMQLHQILFAVLEDILLGRARAAITMGLAGQALQEQTRRRKRQAAMVMGILLLSTLEYSLMKHYSQIETAILSVPAILDQYVLMYAIFVVWCDQLIGAHECSNSEMVFDDLWLTSITVLGMTLPPWPDVLAWGVTLQNMWRILRLQIWGVL
ncbi:hypothetical protein TruAng_003559 [Truncatella angustata]|nr:hypothetical protein TruAng_003559 [Truncatella angustata]